MNHIAQHTAMPKRTDQFLGSFEIVPRKDYEQGRPYQQTRLVACAEQYSTRKFFDPLKSHTNWRGRWYAESHVEEWVARTPSLLFPKKRIHVVASQNYAHLGEKIDLLVIDSCNEFHVIEVKAERVASNRGITPDQIHGQMNRYVKFLEEWLPPLPGFLAKYYEQFSLQFVGSSHDLVTELRAVFGEAFRPFVDHSVVLHPTFLTEGYDEYAVDFFAHSHLNGRGPVRLIYYNFYLRQNRDRHFIEFWEAPMPGGRTLRLIDTASA